MKKETSYTSIVGSRYLRNLNQTMTDLYLVHCGEQQCPPGYTYDHKIPNEYHLHFVLSGKGVLEVNNTLLHIKKDDIFLIPKGVPIQYFADSQDPWKYMWLTFDGTLAKTYLMYAGLSEQTPLIHSAVPNKVYESQFVKILNANELTVSNEILRVGLLYEILASLIDAQGSLNPKNKEYDHHSVTYVDYALQFIKDNYSHIKVSDIANYVGINRSYLTSIFKKQLNVSPQEYLVSYRLKRGAELLSSTNLSIAEISTHIGYENQMTFSKIFKQMYGVSPKKYRWGCQETETDSQKEKSLKP